MVLILSLREDLDYLPVVIRGFRLDLNAQVHPFGLCYFSVLGC